MIIEAIKLAAEFNRYFTSANGVDVPAKVSVSRDEWRALFTAIQQAEAQQPAAQTEREAFEAEMRCEETWGHRSLKRRPDGRYQNWRVDLMWDVWQARAYLPSTQQPDTTEPVAWLYVEDGEVMFGHPNGYRPADARPLVFGDTHPAPSSPTVPASAYDRLQELCGDQARRLLELEDAPSVPYDVVRHIVGWWLCNEANPQDGSPWTTEPSQRVLDHMKVVSGEKHTVMRLVAIDAAMLAT